MKDSIKHISEWIFKNSPLIKTYLNILMKSSASIFKFIFDFFKSFSSTCDQKSEISLDIILLNSTVNNNLSNGFW